MYEIRPAKRSATKPTICLYAWSGRGKTYSALLLARGYAGSTGKVLVIDSENKRASIYADVIPGGYDVIDLTKFSPKDYLEAIHTAEAAKPDVLVIDGFSPEWEGEGGVLDMAAANEAAGRKGLLAWKDPKMAHNRLILALIGTSIPCVIITLRGKFKSHQKGKEVIKDTFVTPIQSDEFVYETTMHMEILDGHAIRVTKPGHPDLRACLPADNTTPITMEHGAAIAEWCRGGEHTKTPPIVIKGREEAAKGKEKFRNWWNLDSTKEQWSILRGYVAEFQRIAEQADEVERRKNAKYDDPFPEQTKEPTPEEQVAAFEAEAAAAATPYAVDALVGANADWTNRLPPALMLRVETAVAAAKDRLNEAAA